MPLPELTNSISNLPSLSGPRVTGATTKGTASGTGFLQIAVFSITAMKRDALAVPRPPTHHATDSCKWPANGMMMTTKMRGPTGEPVQEGVGGGDENPRSKGLRASPP